MNRRVVLEAGRIGLITATAGCLEEPGDLYDSI